MFQKCCYVTRGCQTVNDDDDDDGKMTPELVEIL